MLDASAIEWEEKPWEVRAGTMLMGLGMLVLTSLMDSVIELADEWKGENSQRDTVRLGEEAVELGPGDRQHAFEVVQDYATNRRIVRWRLDGHGRR